jgi:hypothetical protein
VIIILIINFKFEIEIEKKDQNQNFEEEFRVFEEIKPKFFIGEMHKIRPMEHVLKNVNNCLNTNTYSVVVKVLIHI